MSTRRDFLKSTAAAGGVVLTSGVPALARAASTLATPHASAPLSILVLGGTGFIGPHLVNHAVARGHKVTIFTRGLRSADIPESVVRLVGDRDGKLGALEGKKWDAVIDDSATNPSWVKQSTELLRGNVGRYLFTSSTGVYYPYLKRLVDETMPVLTELSDPKDGSMDFGTKKANCEKQVMTVFGDRGVVVRPTYIVGPGDTTNRFPYWPQRLVKGGDVLAPGKKDDPIQIIDVRDLAEFMVKLLEGGRGGIYNAAGPKSPMMIRDFYQQAATALNAKVNFVYVDDYDFLLQHKIEDAVPWIMLRGNDYGHTSAKNDKAIAAGLGFRPLATTVKDTLTWWNNVVPQTRKDDASSATGRGHFAIVPEQEASALADWKTRR
jgi:nucleoside-diphosphate-sugar epimerase